MATIRDVARVARVAPSTVSFVINKSHTVRPDTRRRVEAAIESLGYRRQRIGRPSREDQQRHIAVVMGVKNCLPPASEDVDALATLRDVRPSTLQTDNMLVRSLRRAVVDLGHHIHSFSGYRSVEQDLMLQEAVESREVDGVILLLEHPDDGYLDWLLRQDIPLVVVNRTPTANRRFSHVQMDNFGGGRLVGDHFIANGHRKIAAIQSDTRYSYNQERVAGYLHAAKAAELPAPLVETLSNWSQVQAACQKLIASGVTAVFTTTDTLALDCLKWWHQLGVKVPQELEVVGFDNSGLPTRENLHVSSVGYDVEELGRVAVQSLEHLCQRSGQLAQLSAVVKTFLVERDTTCSP